MTLNLKDMTTIEQIDELLGEVDRRTQEALDKGRVTLHNLNPNPHMCANNECTVMHRGHRTIKQLTRIAHARAEKAKAKLS